MSLLALEEYIAYYYKNKRFVDMQYSNPDKILNERQLKSKYETYVKRSAKKAEKLKSQIEDDDSEYLSDYVKDLDFAKKECIKLDSSAKVFFASLTEEEKQVVYNGMNISPVFAKIDPAHIFGTGAYPHMASDLDNIIALPRCVHSNMDTYNNPLSAKHEGITKEQRKELWIKFIGIERYRRLEERSNETK